MKANTKNQTGPLTAAGKKRSSMNARTHGLYSRTLLPSEDPNEFKALVQSLHDEWCVKGTHAEILINDIALCYYRLWRLELAKSVKSNSYFSNHLNRKDFCIRLGLDLDDAKKMPDWFFDTSLDHLKRCQQAKMLKDQCNQLRKNLTPEVIKNAHMDLRYLWLYIMCNVEPEKNGTITQRICQLFGNESESISVELLYKEIQRDHRFELLWLSQRQRILDLIRERQASHTILVMTRPDWLKAEASIQRQISTNMGQLMAIKIQQSTDSPEVIEALPTK